MYRILIFLCMSQLLLALNIDEKIPFIDLLPHAQVYVDDTRALTLETVKDKTFKENKKKQLGFGYAPDFNVWVKIELTNPYDEKIKKVIEYTNPLTTNIDLYDAQTKELLFQGGTTHSSVLKSINPAFPVILPPNGHKVYYLKASSSVTTLRVGLTLWDVNSFYQKESKHQFILALFFGAMGIIILYNLFIYLSIREKVYLYYVLGFAGIILHHLFYRGLAGLYFFTPEETTNIVKYAAFIVATPTFFLALFTKNMLKLEKYPKLNKFLDSYLVIFVVMTILSYFLELNNLRNLFSVIMLCILFFVTFYTLFKNNRQAKFIMLGWVALLSSGILMYFSSIGYFNVFTTFPYYVEISLLIETLLFSLILADRLKQLRNDKIASQKHLIEYQAEEEYRLTSLAEEKTLQLKMALKEKDLLLQELNHRVKNSMQTIISFLRLEKDEFEDPKSKAILQNVENKVFAINDLYALLHTEHNIVHVDAHEYFSKLIANIQKSFGLPPHTVKLNVTSDLRSHDALYCGFILNEALTNIYQHAFSQMQTGNIFIDLTKKDDINYFNIKDNGNGYIKRNLTESLGMVIIETLATMQLNGKIELDSSSGLEIKISWRDHA